MKKEKIVFENRIVLITDIHHFMTVAKILRHEQYKFLQEFYEILGEIVINHGGELIKYLGDGFICIFPEDLDSEAIIGAQEMRKAFLKIVKTWKLPQETVLEVGISGGEIVIGNFGHKSLRQRDIFGDIVNQAAIICHHRGIAITEWVYNKIKNKYAVQKLPDRLVKGKDDSMEVWEVVEPV